MNINDLYGLFVCFRALEEYIKKSDNAKTSVVYLLSGKYNNALISLQLQVILQNTYIVFGLQFHPGFTEFIIPIVYPKLWPLQF